MNNFNDLIKKYGEDIPRTNSIETTQTMLKEKKDLILNGKLLYDDMIVYYDIIIHIDLFNKLFQI